MLKREDVVWAYRLCLDREPESESVVQYWLGKVKSRRALVLSFLSSDEHTKNFGGGNSSPFWHYQSSFDAIEIINRHKKTGIHPSPSHVTNFLGVKIRPEFLSTTLSEQAGSVQPVPIPANWHADIAEWASCLRSLELSGKRFVMVEVGCGWGCWMNNLGVAAKSMRKEIKLYGIEADEGHLRFARDALRDNGIESDEFVLSRGIAGRAASVALFPKIESGVNWGGAAIFQPTIEQLKEADANEPKYVRIRVIDIDALIKDERVVDLFHVDIQGAELELLSETFDLLSMKIRYVFVGTHSKQIEGGLFDLFLRNSAWRLEMERPAIFQLIDGRPVLTVDGVQGWRNTAID